MTRFIKFLLWVWCIGIVGQMIVTIYKLNWTLFLYTLSISFILLFGKIVEEDVKQFLKRKK